MIEKAPTMSRPRRAMVIGPGVAISSIPFVVQGRIAVDYVPGNGPATTILLSEKGCVCPFSVNSLLSDATNPLRARSECETTLLLIPGVVFKAQCASEPSA